MPTGDIMKPREWFLANADPDTRVPYLDEVKWKKLNEHYTKDEIITGLVEHIVNTKPEFPYGPRHSKLEIREMFLEVKARDSVKECLIPRSKMPEVFEKFEDYGRKYETHGIGVIDCHGSANPISDYFQFTNRHSCGSYGFESPLDRWNKNGKLDKLFMALWRMGISDLIPSSYRACFQLNSYVATQFKPEVAKIMYNLFQAQDVLDTSCGWGDRLAGFYLSNAKSYTGTDPNPATFEVYKKQAHFYEEWCLGTDAKDIRYLAGPDWFRIIGQKDVTIYRSASEDLTQMDYGIESRDILFTSPPYFSTERYAEGTEKSSDQSWSRYDSYEKWRDGYFFRMLDKSWEAIRPGGYLCINLMDPKIKTQRYYASDDFIDYLIKKPNTNFVGLIGMAIQQRPKKMESEEALNVHMNRCYIEPVWVLQKTNGMNALNTLDIELTCKPSSISDFF